MKKYNTTIVAMQNDELLEFIRPGMKLKVTSNTKNGNGWRGRTITTNFKNKPLSGKQADFRQLGRTIIGTFMWKHWHAACIVISKDVSGHSRLCGEIVGLRDAQYKTMTKKMKNPHDAVIYFDKIVGHADHDGTFHSDF